MTSRATTATLRLRLTTGAIVSLAWPKTAGHSVVADVVNKPATPTTFMSFPC